MNYEYLELSVSSVALAKIESLFRDAANAEWEDDRLQQELLQLANDCASRLGRIAKGDLQPKLMANTASLDVVAEYLGNMDTKEIHKSWIKRAQEELHRLADLEF